MKKLLFSLLLLSSINLFSQEFFKVFKVNDISVTGSYVVLSLPKELGDPISNLIIGIPSQTSIFTKVLTGDFMNDYYTVYSNDNKFKFVFSECSIDVYDIKNKIKLYTLETEKIPY
jgi:hypothetical protein